LKFDTPVNQYDPWKETGQTEAEYYKAKYIEAQAVTRRDALDDAIEELKQIGCCADHECRVCEGIRRLRALRDGVSQ
jgi:hypothetical protein